MNLKMKETNYPTDLSPCDFKPLVDYINDIYIGDLISIKQNLSRAIYLLHYVSNEDAPKEDLQKVSFGLQELVDNLYECHERKRRKKD